MYILRYKVLFSFIVLSVFCAIVFTPPLYAKSDLQVEVGFRAAEVSWDGDRAVFRGQGNSTSDTLYGMCVGVSNCNVWGIGKRGVIALGFMDGVSASFSEQSAVGAALLLGPAFAASMGKVLVFQFAPAFSLGVLRVEPSAGYSGTSAAVGFALDARVCFMPESRAGPLVGARYEYSDITSLFDRDIDRNVFTFYAGVSMHLSNLF